MGVLYHFHYSEIFYLFFDKKLKLCYYTKKNNQTSSENTETFRGFLMYLL